MSVKAIHRKILIQEDILYEHRKRLRRDRDHLRELEERIQRDIVRINIAKRNIFLLLSQLEEKDR